MEKGFTLLELLVSLLIFMMVIIGIYFFFDQGQWLYLETDRKSRIQETARITLEQMERDFRMIGAGVPTGTGDSGAVWTPVIFTSSVCTIGFTGDIDNGTEDLSHNVGTDDDSHIFIGENTYYSKTNDANGDDTLDSPLPIVLVSNGRNWEDLIATSLDSTDTAIVTTADVTNPASFEAIDSTVHTLERVFYRMVDQAGNVDADGVCTDPEPYCSIQRQEFQTNNPDETDPETEAAGATWETIAKNVASLQFLYYGADGAVEVADPSTAVKIRIELRVRDRARRAGITQDSLLMSEVLIRNRRL